MQINVNGFQACDIRGRCGEGPESDISPLHAFAIGRALAKRVPPGETLVTAGDGRATTPTLLASLEAGYGRPTLGLGPATPTPLLYLAKHLSKAHSSAMVTASHNPPGFNGIKVQVGPYPPTPDLIAELRDTVTRLVAKGLSATALSPDSEATGAARRKVWEHYLDMAAAAFGQAQGMRVALDGMHGCYSGLAREAMASTGYEVTALRDSVLGDFGGRVPNPAEDSNLDALAREVCGDGYAFGIALDGDGDRARFMDEKGRPVDNGTMLVLLVRYLIATARSAGRTKVVYDQKMRLAVVHALAATGAEPVMERSGHTFIRSRMLREHALFGGESSGHFFWGTVYPVPAGDCGLFSALAVGAMLRFFGRPLSALAADVPSSPWYTGDIRGLRYGGDRRALLAGMAAALERTPYRVGTQDGLRIETDSAFAHLRASVTESNMLTAAFDAVCANDLQELAARVIDVLPEDAVSIGNAIRARVTALRAQGTAREG